MDPSGTNTVCVYVADQYDVEPSYFSTTPRRLIGSLSSRRRDLAELPNDW